MSYHMWQYKVLFFLLLSFDIENVKTGLSKIIIRKRLFLHLTVFFLWLRKNHGTTDSQNKKRQEIVSKPGL